MTQDHGEILLYQAENGHTALEVHLEQETVWLSQAQMVDLFDCDQSVISRHINNVFKEGELNRESTMQKMHIAHSDRPVAFFNLDVLALLIAESAPEHKELMIRLVENLVDGQ